MARGKALLCRPTQVRLTWRRETRRSLRILSALNYRPNYSWDLLVHSNRMAGVVLSERLATHRPASSTTRSISTAWRLTQPFMARPKKPWWVAGTPKGFLFAATVQQEIAHAQVLVDCDAEFKTFLTTMEILGENSVPHGCSSLNSAS